MTRIVAIFIVFLYVGVISLQAQKKPKVVQDSTKNFKLIALPVLFYLPETGLGYGGLGLATFRLKGESKSSRPSAVQLGITFTSKRQFLFFMPYEIYSDDEKWRFIGELGYYQYFYNFYGRGINASIDDLETYDADFPRFRFSTLREIAPNFSIGAGYEFDGFNVIRLADGGLLENSNEVGKEGGTISNLGLLAFYDTRDNIFFPTKGLFIQGSAFTSAKFLGSSFSYHKFELDARYYRQLKGKHILAANAFLGTRSKNTPFLDLNFLGSKRTRGYNNRRFQDNTEVSLALEYRFPIKGRFAGTLFGSTGTVSPDIGAAFSSAYKNAAGAGIRYILNRKEGTRIRVDYGLSSEGGQFYFTINEAF
ncbi:BamA/TamA family outer membrane protein [Maribacter sp. 2210JD10-5]|uniref:BamA/TamA family outer membrane protein n=1 Tax=Maribacter sp. 2210JD10-5 TaxID=3386272 RepID=UPI0039BC8DC6